MNVEKLAFKRQLNVQEQNALEKHKLKSVASYWRQHDLASPLRRALEEKGIDLERSIIIEYAQDEPGGFTDEGIVLTPSGEFFEFDVDLSADRRMLVTFHTWKDISAQFEINEHRPGTGASRGFLALQVMSELNNC